MEFVRHQPIHFDNVVDAFDVVEDVPHAIGLVEEVVVHFPIEGHPIEDHRSIQHRIVVVPLGQHQLLVFLFRRVSWDAHLRVEVEVVVPFQQDLLEVVADVEDEGFGTLPTVLLALVSWGVLHVVDTCLEEDLVQAVVLLANREAAARAIHTVPASPCSREELRIPVVGIVVVVAYGHGLGAFHRVAYRQLCASCLVVEQRSPP